MAQTILRGFLFQGVINLKQDDGTSPANVLPYVIPGGAVVQVHLPADTKSPNNGAPVILSSANALPSPLTGNEVTIVNAAEGQISFTCPISKSELMLVGTNLTLDVSVIADPSTLPNPVNVQGFEKQKTINVKDPDNA